MIPAKAARLPALALWAVLALAQQTAPAPYSPRIRDYHVRSYRLELSFNWAERAVDGEALVTLEPLRGALREVELDAGNMEVHSVAEAGGMALSFQQPDPEKLRIQLNRSYANGEAVAVRIRYRARPRRGLKFLVPDENDPRRPRQIWTVGEPEKNHYWFPCNDAPHDFATVEIIATVDDPYRVVSNGRLVAATPNLEKRTTTYHWLLEQPIPAYLVSIVVGQFDEIRHAHPEVPMFSYVPAARAAEARLNLAESAGMMTFFASKLGVPYPFAKYSQTFVADFPGGVENTSATTLGEALLYPERVRNEERLSLELLLGHEMAHQWFGSLVGPADWSDIWLNESFATYFAHLYQEHVHGPEALESGLWNAQRTSLADWQGGNHRALVTKIYSDPDELFDGVIYGRGAAVLHMLRYVLGDELWWKSLRYYLNTNAHDSVDTGRFQKAVEQASGQNLAWFFDQWVRGAGQPVFEVSSLFDAGSNEVSVRVHQAAPVFQTPVDICLAARSGETVKRVWIGHETETFRFPVSAKPEFVAFDCEGRLLKTLRFDKPAEEVAAQALRDSHVAGRLWAVAELGRTRSAVALEALATAVTGDPQTAVKVEAVRSLGGYDDALARRALVAAMADTAPEMRREALKALALHPYPQLEREALLVIAKDPSDLVVAQTVRFLGGMKSENAAAALRKALERPSRRDIIRIASLNALGSQGERTGGVFSLVVPYARPPYPPAVRAAALTAALKSAPDRPDAREELFSLCRSALFGGGSLKLSAARGFAQLRDERATPLLETFLRDDPNPGPFDLDFRALAKNALHELQAAHAGQ